jgi:predicted nucleic acid-binding protein
VLILPYSQSIFIDTTGFLALTNQDDENHESARKFINTWKDQLPEYKSLITSDYIVSETITKIRFWIGNEEAIEFGKNLLNSNLVEIIHTAEDIFKSAWQIFNIIESENIRKGYFKIQPDYHPKEPNFHPKLSFIDAVTLACIKEFKIPSLFAFDEHIRHLAEKTDLKQYRILDKKDLMVYPKK